MFILIHFIHVVVQFYKTIKSTKLVRLTDYSFVDFVIRQKMLLVNVLGPTLIGNISAM